MRFVWTRLSTLGVPTQNSESQRNSGVSPAFRVLSRDRQAMTAKTTEAKARKAAYDKRRRATPEGKAQQAEYDKRWSAKPENKARHAEAPRRRRATPEGKAD